MVGVHVDDVLGCGDMTSAFREKLEKLRALLQSDTMKKNAVLEVPGTFGILVGRNVTSEGRVVP